MIRKMISDYFLGANSCFGFFSLYQEIQKDPAEFVYVIKGSPGSGKSTFMKKIAEAAEAEGAEVERIHCSGDPDSLDGIRIPALHISYVDGTSPHVVEPELPGLKGAYLHLLPEKCNPALENVRDDLIRLESAYKNEYQIAYRYLRSLHALIPKRENSVEERVRLRKIASDEIVFSGSAGPIREIFLGSFSYAGYQGVLPFCDFPNTDFVSVYGEHTEWFMRECLTIADENRLPAICCKNPLEPEKTDHVIFPNGTSFLSANAINVNTFKANRELILSETDTAIPDPKASDVEQLKAEAADHLQKAKDYHNLLEQTYRPFMDYALCEKKTRAHVREIVRQLQKI